MSFVLFLISHWKKNIWEVLPPNIHPPTHMILCLCAIFLTSKRRRVLSSGTQLSRFSDSDEYAEQTFLHATMHMPHDLSARYDAHMPNKLFCALQFICRTIDPTPFSVHYIKFGLCSNARPCCG